MTAIGVLYLHGMGSQKEGYSSELDKRLKHFLKSRPHSATLATHEGFWADLLSKREDDLWKQMKAAADLDFASLRRFVIGALGDAIAYRPVPTTEPTTYHQIHIRIYEELEKLRTMLPDGELPLLILVGHSLGSVMLSDHVWDEQTKRGHGRNPFTKCESLAGFFTFGSTLPLFTLGLVDVAAITFPAPELSGPARNAARWINFYDSDDALGYPLKPTSESHNRAVSQDRAINVGSIATSWNPACHTAYWTSDDVAEEIGKLILRLSPP